MRTVRKRRKFNREWTLIHANKILFGKQEIWKAGMDWGTRVSEFWGGWFFAGEVVGAEGADYFFGG